MSQCLVTIYILIYFTLVDYAEAKARSDRALNETDPENSELDKSKRHIYAKKFPVDEFNEQEVQNRNKTKRRSTDTERFARSFTPPQDISEVFNVAQPIVHNEADVLKMMSDQRQVLSIGTSGTFTQGPTNPPALFSLSEYILNHNMFDSHL
jgi:hypothetical protein